MNEKRIRTARETHEKCKRRFSMRSSWAHLLTILAAMLTEPLTGTAFLEWREGELGGTGSEVVDVAVVFVPAAEVPRPTETERCCVVTADVDDNLG